jgi:hypothetical protein
MVGVTDWGTPEKRESEKWGIGPGSRPPVPAGQFGKVHVQPAVVGEVLNLTLVRHVRPGLQPLTASTVLTRYARNPSLI